MKSYKLLNNVLGWIVFVIASTVYILTSEPTASFWDCGEYISTAYKLLVGHPPGAPLFQLIGRFFSLFAMGDVHQVARMVNTMTALASGFTILFLFWSITHLARKILEKSGEMTERKMYAVLGSGLVGALAYTFSDSFWFSAVEGEVYGMSSFFTAIVFWAILKWEAEADQKHANRWIILICFLVGLSIGVHLLNLLAIPAITFIVYFKKVKSPTRWGIIKIGLFSIILLAAVMSGVIPWVLKLAGLFELLFVNSFGMPFQTGTIIYFILLISGIVWGLYYTRKHGRTIANTALLGLTFILIGYSSFLMLVIRSNANTPIDENNPEDAVNLLAYMNREQYGDWPILYGQYYNAPVVDRKDGSPVYSRDKKSGRYIISDDKKGALPVYDPRFMTLFPRMWSNTQPQHEEDYKKWGHVKGVPIQVQGRENENETVYKPTFGENLAFAWNYQFVYMYYRYFMWNFVGRQNDRQGDGNLLDGNWISGIKFLDEARLGPQDNIPDSLKSKGTNKFYFLPLLLGLAGFFYQWKRNHKDTLVIGALFVMTGLAIIVYLNQYSPQPRERDYAYAGSFYAFAIWIGLGVLALSEYLGKWMKSGYAPIVVTAGCLFLVPGIMGRQGWDDHNRAHRYTVINVASNYLNTCAPDAVLFTNGDNDTFPLWYAQEVEGVRRDVRVCNLSLLQTDWYIDQMKRKAYESDPVPFSLKRDQYRQGTRDIVYLIEKETIPGYVDLKELFDLIQTNEKQLKIMTGYGELDYFPTKQFKVTVDSATVVNNGTVPKDHTTRILPAIEWKLKENGVQKNHLMVLDLLATNNWKRPVYFVASTSEDSYVGLTNFFQLEGMAYRLVPMNMKSIDGQIGLPSTTIMYNNLMTKFRYGMNDPRVYLSEDNIRMAMTYRNLFGRLANALIKEGKKDSAVKVCDRCLTEFPEETVYYNYFVLPLAEVYYKAGATGKADKLMSRLIDIYEKELGYYFSFPAGKGKTLDEQKQQDLAIMQRIGQVTEEQKRDMLYKKAKLVFNKYYVMYGGNPQGDQ